MPIRAADLSTQYGDLAFMDRFEAAAQAGFDGVEFLFPYSYPVEQIAHRLCSHGLRLVQYCLPAGDWPGGERGIACHPQRVAEFRYGVEEAIRYARPLGVRQLRCLAGLQPAEFSTEAAHQTLVANLRHAAAQLKPHHIVLRLAMLDEPDYFVHNTEQARAIIRETGSDNLLQDQP